jgi:hypothetical protein
MWRRLSPACGTRRTRPLLQDLRDHRQSPPALPGVGLKIWSPAQAGAMPSLNCRHPVVIEGDACSPLPTTDRTSGQGGCSRTGPAVFRSSGRGAQVPSRRGQQGDAGAAGRTPSCPGPGRRRGHLQRLRTVGDEGPGGPAPLATRIHQCGLAHSLRLPLTAFAAEADTGSPRYVRFDESALPPLSSSAGWQTEQEKSCLGN